MVAAVPELARELLALLARVKRGGDYPVILTKVQTSLQQAGTKHSTSRKRERQLATMTLAKERERAREASRVYTHPLSSIVHSMALASRMHYTRPSHPISCITHAGGHLCPGVLIDPHAREGEGERETEGGIQSRHSCCCIRPGNPLRA